MLRPPADPALKTPTPDTAGTRDWRALFATGLKLARAGDAAGAACFLQRAALGAPDRADVRLALATVYLRCGDPEAALADFSIARQFDPASPAPLHGEGLARHALDDRTGALEAFRRAVIADPLAFRSWGSIADLACDEAERINAVEAAADALVVLCNSEGRHAELWKACAGALLNARRPRRAAQFLRAHAASVAAAKPGSQHLAHALYEQGAFRDAFEAAQLAFDPEPAGPDPEPLKFTPDVAVRALTAITAILEAAGIRSFLTAGTLLGFCRGGAPLSHDRDIDIGVLRDPDGGPDIAGVLRAYPGILMPRRARAGDRYFPVFFQGIGIDIFLYDTDGRALVCGFGNIPGDIQWRFSRFGLAERRFGGRRWRVPDAPERYLADCYGPGWQTPDTHFASVLSSPALSGVDEHVRGCYAIWRALKALRPGDRTKAAALLCRTPLTTPFVPRLYHPAADKRRPDNPQRDDNPFPDDPLRPS